MSKAILIDGVFVPQNLTYPHFAPAFIVLALAGEPNAKHGYYGRVENWINARIDLAIFPDCRELLRWMSRNRLGGVWQANPDLLAKTYLPQAFAILEKSIELKEQLPPSQAEEAPTELAPDLLVPPPAPTPTPMRTPPKSKK